MIQLLATPPIFASRSVLYHTLANKNDGITLKVEKRSAGQMWDKIRLSEDDLEKERQVETGNTTYC